MEEIKGYINKIINFSAVDGIGNRTVVFFQGCNLNCVYCHNPETINFCDSCGLCIKKCKSSAIFLSDDFVQYNKDNCTDCDECIKTCNNLSSPKILELTPKELLNKILRLKPFISGITLSGGECTLQHDFLFEFMKLAKNERFEIFLDTNGYADKTVFEKLLPYFDKAMFDIKAYDNQNHILLTGKPNEIILQNFEFLAQNNKIYEARTVVMNGFIDFKKEVEQIAEFVKRTNPDIKHRIIPFRAHGYKAMKFKEME